LEQLLESLDLGQPWSLERPIEHSYSAIVIPMMILVTGTADQIGRAEKAAQAVLASRTAAPESSQWARLGLAILAVHQGHIAAAAEQYTHLQSSSAKMTKAGTVTIPRVLGLLAQTSGHVDLAASHFEDGLAFCRKAGYRPELAWTCYDYANLLLEMRQHKRRFELLREALSLSTELGMRPLIDKVIGDNPTDPNCLATDGSCRGFGCRSSCWLYLASSEGPGGYRSLLGPHAHRNLPSGRPAYLPHTVLLRHLDVALVHVVDQKGPSFAPI
jgi:hypothetical protein